MQNKDLEQFELPIEGKERKAGLQTELETLIHTTNVRGLHHKFNQGPITFCKPPCAMPIATPLKFHTRGVDRPLQLKLATMKPKFAPGSCRKHFQSIYYCNSSGVLFIVLGNLI